jgi:hypothetical protein
MNSRFQMLARHILAVLMFIAPLSATAQNEPIGIVIMHGKSGTPAGFVADLASALEDKGYLVTNLEMPWSERLMFSLPVSKGTYQINTIPAAYLTWYELAGAMNLNRAARAANPKTPVLWVAPTRDYPGLLKSGSSYFGMLPPNPNTRIYRPESDHLRAPAASVDEIVRWTRAVAAAPQR